jgi:hypothetical protein
MKCKGLLAVILILGLVFSGCRQSEEPQNVLFREKSHLNPPCSMQSERLHKATRLKNWSERRQRDIKLSNAKNAVFIIAFFHVVLYIRSAVMN